MTAAFGAAETLFLVLKKASISPRHVEKVQIPEYTAHLDVNDNCKIEAARPTYNEDLAVQGSPALINLNMDW